VTQPATATRFNRAGQITIGTVTFPIGTATGLDVWFQAKRNLKAKEPNTCDLKIWNLAASTRSTIEQYTASGVVAGGAPPGAKLGGLAGTSTIIPVRIEAGYVGNVSTVFVGEMRTAQTVQDGTDYVTEIDTGDGDEAALLARSSASFGSGANAYVVATKLLLDMGCGVGNIATVASILRSAPLFAGGYILKGRSIAILDDLARSCGLEVTIQGGIAQWLSAGQPLGGSQFRLSSGYPLVPGGPVGTNTGLIGSPTKDTKGIVHAECLMLPGLAPGQPIMVQAEFIQGQYRILAMETTGDTHGADWSTKLELGTPGVNAP
jgi:hypothetical protein